MRIIAGAASVALCLVFLQTPKAEAISFDITASTSGQNGLIAGAEYFLNPSLQSSLSSDTQDSESLSNSDKTEDIGDQSVIKRKLVRYEVREGDTLISIARNYNTSWKRIFAKNKQIAHPDQLEIGQKLIIPGKKEKLKQREIANQAPDASTFASTGATTEVTEVKITVPQYSNVGNTYYYGYCTWYAKSQRPDLPNNLGNADTWVYRAAAQGIPTGSQARVGAIGQQGMHVVFVEAVHGNGTVTVSEMNYEGWGVVSTRTVPASSFMYIY